MNAITEKKLYVESLNEMLKPMQDFDSIKYGRTHSGAEYVRISDTIGGCAFLDVTGESLQKLLEDVAKLICKEVPANVVYEKEVMRKIAPLFR